MPTQIALSQQHLSDFAAGHALPASLLRRPRLWLALVLMASVLPLLVLAGLTAEAMRRDALAELKGEVLASAGRAAQAQGLALAHAARALQAAAPGAGGATGLCAAVAGLLAQGPADVAAVAAYHADGAQACGVALAESAALPGFAALRGALASDGVPVLSADPQSGLVMARAVGPGQAIVLALVLRPPPVLPSFAGAALFLVDPADGLVLTGVPETGGMRAGDHIHAPRLLAAMRDGQASGDGLVLARDAAGAQVLFAHAALPPWAGTMAGAMVVRVPFGAALAAMDARRSGQWLLALIAALLAGAGAWQLGMRALVYPLAAARAAVQADRATYRPGAAWLRQQADLAVAAEFSGDMVLRLDGDLRVVYASPATRAVLGYPPADMVGAQLAGEPAWDVCRAQLEEMRQGGSTVAPALCRFRARRRDDSEVWLEVRASRLADGGFVLACRDVGAEQAAEQQLAEAQKRLATLALEDPETGLANHRRFSVALDQEVRRARRAQEPMSLVLLRVDDTGAESARRTAGVLTAALRRPGDMAARLEEGLFALLLPITDRIGAQRVAERLHESLAIGWSDGMAAAVGAFRIGACSTLPLGEDQHPQAILDLAHAALADARAGGLAVRAADDLLVSLPAPARVAAG